MFGWAKKTRKRVLETTRKTNQLPHWVHKASFAQNFFRLWQHYRRQSRVILAGIHKLIFSCEPVDIDPQRNGAFHTDFRCGGFHKEGVFPKKQRKGGGEFLSPPTE
jgi:hypothetical protein